MQTFNELFDAHKTEGDILSIVSKAEEFDQIKVRIYHELQKKKNLSTFLWLKRDKYPIKRIFKVHLECFIHYLVVFFNEIAEQNMNFSN